MKQALILRPDAESDIAAAYRWYEEQRQGLGSHFILCVEAALTQIERHPESYQLAHKNIRRALTKRFPYGVFYLIESSRIVVLAVFHVKQSPRRWKRRSS